MQESHEKEANAKEQYSHTAPISDVEDDVKHNKYWSSPVEYRQQDPDCIGSQGVFLDIRSCSWPAGVKVNRRNDAEGREHVNRSQASRCKTAIGPQSVYAHPAPIR